MTLRIGIVGSGFMGRTHADAAAKIDEAAPVAITGGSRAEQVAIDYAMDHLEDLETLLARDDIDAIVVATPHWLHFEQTMAAAQAGKHVLVEKPMATSVAHCDQMIAEFEKRGLTLSVGYHQRFRDANRITRQLLNESAIGPVHCIEMSALFDITALRKDSGFGGTWGWWTDPRSIAHLMNSGPHNIDLCRWWMNCDIQSVAAVSDTYREENPNENTTMALLRFTNGAMSSYWSSSVVPQPGFPGEAFRFRIMGRQGTIDLDPYDKLMISVDGETRCEFQQPPIGHDDSNQAFAMPRMRAYCEQMQAFAQSIQGTPGGEGSADDGRAAVSAVVAMLKSASEGVHVAPE